MIPSFPKFKKISISDKEEISKVTKQFAPYSDYNFLSLWGYNIAGDMLISQRHNNLLVRFRDYITNEHVYSFLGTHDVVGTANALLTLAVKEGVVQYLKLISEESILADSNLHTHFIIREDRDNFDYILSVEQLRHLKNKTHHGQRNFLNRFTKHYAHCTVSLLNLQNKKVHQQVIDVFHTWGRGKGKTKEDIEHELIAVERTLTNIALFKTIAIGIYDNDRLIGFIIADLERNEYAQSHFAKADPAYVGIFAALYHNLAKQLHLKKYTFINNEQDLGIAGLRMAKEQWKPVRYLKKYIIIPKVSSISKRGDKDQ